MAAGTKKDKLLEEAQKLALRGQFDKAVKVYEQLLSVEPTAINLRQKLAELLLKAGRSDDARGEFEKIGTYYSKNKFFLKAIAVYKQLQKLFPTDISLSLTLAELNAKHGLTANALSEYKRVHDFYEQSGDRTAAISILDKMQNADPKNIPIKIKLAEALLQQGKQDESYNQFSRAAALLQERGEHAALTRLTTRIQELFPTKTEFVLEVLAEQVAAGNAADAMVGLQRLLRANPVNKRAWELVITAYQQLEQPPRLKIAYQHYLKYFPHEPTALAGLLECLAAERDLTATLELLDRFETGLFSAGLLQELERIYRALEALDPLNRRVLKGLLAVVTARGNDDETEALSSRLQALHSVAGTSATEQEYMTGEAGRVPEQPEQYLAAPEPTTLDNSIFGRTEDVLDMIPANADQPSQNLSGPGEFDLEIDIDIDGDIDDVSANDFGSDSDQAADQTWPNGLQANWLDSAGALFDTINTAPRGVRFGQEMDSSDAQSHFDLGLAFKEMGLFDEAINEFRQASSDPARRMGCLVMQGACLRERGDLEKALGILQALVNPGLSLEDSCAVNYELVITYEVMGKIDQANALLNEIEAANPGFRDVSSRLNAANLESTLDFSDEELQGFGPK